MGRADRDRKEIEALQSALAELSGVIAETTQAVTLFTRERSLPAAGDALDGTAGRLSGQWRSASAQAAAMLIRLSAQIDAVMAPLEDRPQPTFGERASIMLRSALSRLWTRAATAPVDLLGAILVTLDALQSGLSDHRESLLSARHSLEADLIDLGGHRQVLADSLAERALAAGDPTTAAAAAVEARLQAIQDVTVELNREIGDANILLNKLAIEAERAVVLKDVLAPDDPALPVEEEWPDLPHLAPLMGLRDRDMLSSIEIERRKPKIDARFLERFATDRKPAERAGLGTPSEPEAHHA